MYEYVVRNFFFLIFQSIRFRNKKKATTFMNDDRHGGHHRSFFLKFIENCFIEEKNDLFFLINKINVHVVVVVVTHTKTVWMTRKKQIF